MEITEQKVEKAYKKIVWVAYAITQICVFYSAYLYFYDRQKFRASGHLALPCLIGLFIDCLFLAPLLMIAILWVQDKISK